MPLARQKRVGGVSRLVATGRDWSQPVTQPVVIGHASASRNRLSDPLPKTRHKKSRMPESIQAFGCACRDA